MKIDEYIEMFEQDAVIDRQDLSGESLKIPLLLTKYQRHLILETKILKEAECLLEKKKLNVYRYYSGDGTDEEYKNKPLHKKPLKTDIEKYYLYADDDYQKLYQQIQNQVSKVKMIEDQIKQLNQRSFNIKNAIEWERFKAGLN